MGLAGKKVGKWGKRGQGGVGTFLKAARQAGGMASHLLPVKAFSQKSDAREASGLGSYPSFTT